MPVSLAHLDAMTKCESRSPDGDGQRMSNALIQGRGDNLAPQGKDQLGARQRESAGVVIAAQADEGLHGNHLSKSAAGSEPADSLSDFYQTCAIPKPKPREKKAPTRIRRHAKAPEERDRIAAIRDYVFARERGRCRCCRCRMAQSMHELRPRSLRGKVSKTNSIAVCGDGVRGCHGFLQRHEITFDSADAKAEATLYFMPRTEAARTWMKLGQSHGLESKPMREMETD